MCVSYTWEIYKWQVVTVVQRNTAEQERDLVLEKVNKTSTHSMGQEAQIPWVGR